MNMKWTKRAVALLLCLLIAFCSAFVCSAEDNRYEIPEIDDMVIVLPDTMLAATRSSNATDDYFTRFGLNYGLVMNNFTGGDIYLQGMDTTSAITVTVTMTKTNESEGIGNYTLLQDSELTEIKNNFLSNGEYISCTPDSADKIDWLYFDLNVNNNGRTIKAYQANTVYDGMSVNITLQRNTGNVTAQDYQTFSQIVSSVKFLRFGSANSMTPYIIAGFVLLTIILIIVVVVLVKKSKAKSKRTKNNQIIDELADKYNLKSRKKRVEYTEGNSADDSLINANQFEDESIEQDDEIKVYVPDNKKAVGTEDSDESSKQISKEDDESDSFTPVFSDGNDNNVYPQPVYDPEKASELEDFVYGETEVEANEVDDTDEDDDYYNDEVLVRQEIKRTKFHDSDDFFDEAPKKTMGVISSQDIEDAEDYDVITEVEQKVNEVESSKDKNKNKGAFIAVLKNIVNGIKSFGVHCGYFCTNLSRMIKRKQAAKKRRKAEEERRERARLRAARERQQRRELQDGGLVKVHHRDDRRPSQKRTSSQDRRPSQGRRPSQNSRPQTRRPNNSGKRR